MPRQTWKIVWVAMCDKLVLIVNFAGETDYGSIGAIKGSSERSPRRAVQPHYIGSSVGITLPVWAGGYYQTAPTCLRR